ncbi:SDR family oxidoreductase [Kitasatospora sp. NPDC007106]|uniref:SDR family oxidoreductase n=1 Tax=Kitasatospora sp. NPDC007106 TaxID=3156914 RepID=UPI0033FA675B
MSLSPSSPYPSFAGLRIVVMGGSSGIGEAAARAFAAAGADVVITGRSKAGLDAAAERIGHPVTAVEADATSAGSIAACFEAVGRLDHLVLALSSGAVGLGPFAELAEADLRTAFDGKLFAHFAVLRAALPRLREDGSVTFVTAASARAALPGSSGLAAVNGALEAAVPPLAAELAPLRINAVSPGVVDTAWWSGMPDADRAAFFAGVAAALPVGRVGTPEDVAQAIAYLAGNGFTTGTVLDCAGGATLATGR